MKRHVVVLAEAANDIERGIDFYDAIEDGVGRYFRDSIIADLRRLGLYFGEHRIHLGFFRALSSRFPYAIYYRDKDDIRQVVAVLDLRRSPKWIRETLTKR
ncbi:type II toxin-antitoxin system RelE/ParE family toxin [Akkermansiaceae bacterium]|nr:type II toxin-antitoxin system RelE/ParE family toxin [Akkermansiaceae bacterium]